MTDFLIKLLIKDPENIRDEKVRLAYGTLTSATGMCCNIFLFILKGLIGLTIHSISIISDGFNNLSDCSILPDYHVWLSSIGKAGRQGTSFRPWPDGVCCFFYCGNHHLYFRLSVVQDITG
jgi:hypothetical protein